MSIKQISVFLENKPGMLHAMTDVLARREVDMRAFTLAETSDFGIARVIVDDLYKTTTVLKDAGYVHSISDVLGVSVPDEPGGIPGGPVLLLGEEAPLGLHVQLLAMEFAHWQHGAAVDLAEFSLLGQRVQVPPDRGLGSARHLTEVRHRGGPPLGQFLENPFRALFSQHSSPPSS